MKIGKVIKSIRKKTGWSWEAIAVKMGKSRETIRMWEREETTPDQANTARLEEIFGSLKKGGKK